MARSGGVDGKCCSAVGPGREDLARLAQALTASLDLPAVLDCVARAAAAFVPDSASRLWVVEGDRARLRAEAGVLGPPRAGRRTEFAPGEGLAGHVVATRAPLVLDDILADPRTVNRDFAREERLVSFAGIPLIVRGRLEGVLACFTRHRHRFDPEDLDALCWFGAQAAIAIENARLYEDSERRRRAAEGLAEIGRLILAVAAPLEVARQIVENVSRLFGGTMAVLYRIDPSSDLVMLAGAGATVDWNRTLKRGTGAVGLALRERRPVATLDVLTDPRIVLEPEARARIERSQYHAVLAVPLLAGEEVIGALGIGGAAGRVFDDEEVRLAEAFASQAAIALHNADLYAEAERQRREAEASEQRYRDLVQSLDAIVADADAETWRFSFVSQRAEAILGYPVQQWLTEPGFWVNHLHPDDRERVVTFSRSETAAGRDHTLEHRMVSADGRVVWLRDTVRVARGGDGRARIRCLMVDVTASNLTEKSLRESTARARAVLDSALDCVITIDHAGRITEFNPAAERTFGYARAAALGREMAELLIPPALREQRRRGLAHYLATGEGPVIGRRLEFTAMRSDGSEFPVELSVSRIPLDGPPMFTGFVRDISERKRAEEGLRRESGFVRLLQVVAVAANQAATVEEAMRICLSQVCAHTGWPVGHAYLHEESSGELVPTTIWHLDDPGRFDAFQRVTETTRLPAGVGLPGSVLASGKPVWMRDVTADPTFARSEAAKASGLRGGFAVPVPLGTGPAAVLEFFSPDVVEPDEPLLEVMTHIGVQIGRVIERQRAAESLRRSEERYRTLVTNIPEVTWLADRAGRTVFISSTVEKVYGFTPEEIYRAGDALWFERIHPDDLQRVKRHYAALFEDGETFDIEYRVQHKNGRWIWIHDRAVATWEQNGVTYACGLLSDITDRKQAAVIRALLLNQVITVQEEERKRVARELHDETAQSLASLLLGLGALQEARTLKAARSQARDLQGIATRALTEVRRLARGLRPSVLDDLGLVTALERYATDYGQSRGIAVEVRATGLEGDRLPAAVETALYRVMQEALSNVARHAAAKNVRVLLSRGPATVSLDVIDDGRGFEAGDARPSPSAAGGLGVHTMRERAAVLQGSLAIESAPGRGTRVAVEIPLTQDPA